MNQVHQLKGKKALFRIKSHDNCKITNNCELTCTKAIPKKSFEIKLYQTQWNSEMNPGF